MGQEASVENNQRRNRPRLEIQGFLEWLHKYSKTEEHTNIHGDKAPI